MKWTYTFESKVDSGDADWVHRTGELGTFDDTNRADMVKVYLIMILLDEIAVLYSDGTFDTKQVLEFFRMTCASSNIAEEEWEKFIKDEDLEDEMFSFADEYIPQVPDLCRNSNSLSFQFKRIPEKVKAEKVLSTSVDKFVKPLK